jgi:hypothetical protein
MARARIRIIAGKEYFRRIFFPVAKFEYVFLYRLIV